MVWELGGTSVLLASSWRGVPVPLWSSSPGLGTRPVGDSFIIHQNWWAGVGVRGGCKYSSAWECAGSVYYEALKCISCICVIESTLEVAYLSVRKDQRCLRTPTVLTNCL